MFDVHILRNTIRPF